MKDKFRILIVILIIALVATNAAGITLMNIEQKRQTQIAQIEATVELERLNYEQQLQLTKAMSQGDSILEQNVRSLNDEWTKWYVQMKREIAEITK